VIAITSATVKEPIASPGALERVAAGLVGWLKTLSREVGPKGITVNCVAPGPDRHRTARRALSVRPEREDLARSRSGAGSPRELGDVVCFLASERAAYVTGTTIAVDGGLTRGLV
jgi:3-oxoacyl-[acyl-carrier protein] reductase